MIKEGRTSSNKLNYVTELGNIIDGMKSDIEKKGTVNWDEITKDNSKALLISLISLTIILFVINRS